MRETDGMAKAMLLAHVETIDAELASRRADPLAAKIASVLASMRESLDPSPLAILSATRRMR